MFKKIILPALLVISIITVGFLFQYKYNFINEIFGDKLVNKQENFEIFGIVTTQNGKSHVSNNCDNFNVVKLENKKLEEYTEIKISSKEDCEFYKSLNGKEVKITGTLKTYNTNEKNENSQSASNTNYNIVYPNGIFEIKNVEEVIIDITDWKIYEDTSYDFKIKYPNHWADPQIQKIKHPDYQYQVNFGTQETLNGESNEGFFVFASIKNKNEESTNETDDTQKISEDLESKQKDCEKNSSCTSHFFYKIKTKNDYAIYHSYEFMGQEFEYKIVPILGDDTKFYLIEFNNLDKFELAKNTFLIDSESIQEKALERERQRKIAAERARQARLAAERARLIARYPIQNTGAKVCKHGGKPSYSDNKGKHIDEDCCPDPDEWPNLRCRYSAKDYAIMLKGSPPEKLLK